MNFSDALKTGRFLITTDVIPPKGIAISKTLSRLGSLAGKVDAVNVVDLPSSAMRVSSLPIAFLLKTRGLEPILQMTCRDRNRLALQADLLGAYLVGVTNILALTGDEMNLGDDPEAKPVFDLDSIGLLRAASELSKGRDLAGNRLRGIPKFCIGAAVDPGTDPLELEIEKMGKKLEAGADFFQTQPIFDPGVLIEFLRKAGKIPVPLLGGVLLLKSAGMARFMNEKVPGVRVPENLIRQMEQTKNPVQTAIQIASQIINEIKGVCAGLHIMTIHWEDKVPILLEATGLI